MENLKKFKDIQSNIDKICELLKPQMKVTIQRINIITEINKPTCLQVEYMDDTFKHITEDKFQEFITELENN